MKTKVAFLTILALAASVCVFAQSTEDDDMYYTSKDRAALNASHQLVLSSDNARRITESEIASTINPTDSYSARNVNPEYISGVKMSGNKTSATPYFTPNYQPTSVNQNLASNSTNCNCGNSSYNGFNNGYNRYGSFGSPYSNYGGYGYSPYSMMGNGFYGSGLTFGLGLGSGFGYGSGYGSPYGFGNNYYGMNSYNGGYNSFYNPYRYGSNTILVVDRPRPQSTRNQQVDRYYSSTGVRGRNDIGNGGRVAANSTSQPYYNRTWRNDAQVNRESNTWTNSRSYQQNYNNSWNNNNWGSRSDFGGGRSSSFNSGGGGAVTTGGGSSGGGSRRGRD